MTNGIGRVGWRNFVSAPTNNPLWNNLVAYYTGDNTPNDAKGTYNGTLVNGATYSTGKINGGFSFDGVNDYVNFPNDFFKPVSNFSANFWINTNNATTEQTIFTSVASNGYLGWRLFISGGVVTFRTFPINTQIHGLSTSASKYTASNWYMITVINDISNGMNIYVNDTLAASNTIKQAISWGSTTINRLGQNWNNSTVFNGKIDEMALWTKALSSTEVTELYNAGAGKQYVAPTYTTRTTAFAAATGITDTTILNALNTFDTGLISNGLDTKMKALYPFVGGTANTHKYNFMDARDLNAAFRLQFSGGYIHSSTGAKPNGTNAYADTFLVPSTVSASYNSVGASAYLRDNVQFDYGVEFGCYGSLSGNYQFLFLNRTTSNLYNVRVANSGFVNSLGTVTNSSGLFTINRNNSTTQEIYQNGILNASYSIAGTGLPEYNLHLSNTNGLGYINESYSPREMAFAAYHDGLTAGQISTFNTLVTTLQTSLSRAV